MGGIFSLSPFSTPQHFTLSLVWSHSYSAFKCCHVSPPPVASGAPNITNPVIDALPKSNGSYDKKRGEANRRQKRKCQLKPSQPIPLQIRPSIRQKHLQRATNVQTILDTEMLPAASTAFVANERPSGKKVYKLEELIGRMQRFHSSRFHGTASECSFL
jgi:hypothetical protein